MIAAEDRADDLAVPAFEPVAGRAAFPESLQWAGRSGRCVPARRRHVMVTARRLHHVHATPECSESLPQRPHQRLARRCTSRTCTASRASTRARCATSTRSGDDRHMLIVDHRPAVRVRRGAARPDSGQGPRAHEHLATSGSRARGTSCRTTCRPAAASRDVVPDAAERALLADRAMVVRQPQGAAGRGRGARLPDRLRLEGLPAHRRRSAASRCPPGLRMAEQLPAADLHAVDQGRRAASTTRTSVSTRSQQLIGADARGAGARHRDRALRVRGGARARARHHHRRHQVRVRPRRETATLTLIDEVLTPDSSRFWPVDTYAPGTSPPSFDKQFVRDYLETLDWNKTRARPEAAGRRASGTPARSTRKRCARQPRRLIARKLRLTHSPALRPTRRSRDAARERRRSAPPAPAAG